jgi:hypothetical protein
MSNLPVNISKLPSKYFRASNIKENFDITNSPDELIKECYILARIYECACAMFVSYNEIFVAIYVKHNESFAEAISRMKGELDEIYLSHKKTAVSSQSNEHAKVSIKPYVMQEIIISKLDLEEIKKVLHIYEKVERHVRGKQLNLEKIAALVSEAAQIISYLSPEGYAFTYKVYLSIRSLLINNGLSLVIESTPDYMIHTLKFPKNYIYRAMNLSDFNYKNNISIYEDFKISKIEIMILKQVLKYPTYHFSFEDHYGTTDFLSNDNSMDFLNHVESLIKKGYILKVKIPDFKNDKHNFVEKYIATEKAYLEFDIFISSEDVQRIRMISKHLGV